MDDEERPYRVYNPNQRQFIEDQVRYKQKLDQLHAGFTYFKKLTFNGLIIDQFLWNR